MTSIDSTVIPEHLAEEYLDTVIEDGETYVSSLSEPKLVFMTAQYADSTVTPSYTISGRTITFSLTTSDDEAHASPVGFGVLIKGRR